MVLTNIISFHLRALARTSNRRLRSQRNTQHTTQVHNQMHKPAGQTFRWWYTTWYQHTTQVHNQMHKPAGQTFRWWYTTWYQHTTQVHNQMHKPAGQTFRWWYTTWYQHTTQVHNQMHKPAGQTFRWWYTTWYQHTTQVHNHNIKSLHFHLRALARTSNRRLRSTKKKSTSCISSRWYTCWTIAASSGGTPDDAAQYFHNLWWYTTICGASIANSNAAESCIGVRSAGESCRSHKVRCLHLTVNSQWKLLIFTPKRSFGWKSINTAAHNLRLWAADAPSGGTPDGALVKSAGGTPADFHYCGPALTGWSTVYWSSPYGLDQYALQALRPEVQKEKKYMLHLRWYTWDAAMHHNSVVVHIVDQPLRAGPQCMHFGPYGPKCKKARPYGLAVESKIIHILHLRAYALRCNNILTFSLEKKK